MTPIEEKIIYLQIREICSKLEVSEVLNILKPLIQYAGCIPKFDFAYRNQLYSLKYEPDYVLHKFKKYLAIKNFQ